MDSPETQQSPLNPVPTTDENEDDDSDLGSLLINPLLSSSFTWIIVGIVLVSFATPLGYFFFEFHTLDMRQMRDTDKAHDVVASIRWLGGLSFLGGLAVYLGNHLSNIATAINNSKSPNSSPEGEDITPDEETAP